MVLNEKREETSSMCWTVLHVDVADFYIDVHINSSTFTPISMLNVLLRLHSLHWIDFTLTRKIDSMEKGILHNTGIIVSKMLLSCFRTWHIFSFMLVY